MDVVIGERRVWDHWEPFGLLVADRWQHVLRIGETVLRAYSRAPLAEGRHWLQIPPRDLWIFRSDGAENAAAERLTTA